MMLQKRFAGGNRALAVLSMALLLGASVLPARPVAMAASTAAPASQAGGKLVLAFYYMWYGPGDFDRGQMPDRPVAPYASGQAEVIDRQVREARDAGIDAFISSWTGPGTETDKNFPALLDIAARRNFKATLYFETNHAAQHGDVATQLQALLGKYVNHPAFLRWNGKPVVFFWSPQTLGGAAAWRGVRQRLDPGNSQIWSVDTTDQSYLDVFDTIHFFSAAKWNGNTDVARVNAQWRGIVDAYNKSHGTARMWTAGVTPGWDESRIQPPRNPAKVFPRRDGAMYEEAWRGAMASNPEWITITSYNEWFEGTQIEPGAGYANKYLDLTRKYAGLWKNGPNPCDGGTWFPQTGYGICKPMEGYWNQYGGLAQFGYPITGPLTETSPSDGKAYTVQYFERARFELHPEKRGTPYEVMLSQLGTFEYNRKYPKGAPNQKPNMDGGLFPETGKRVGGTFLKHWQAHGGLFVNGFPVSEEFQEQGSDGKVYVVQYFERARFEWHPENQPPYNVLLGFLGRQALSLRGN
jgi:hypothetical protein